MGRLIIKLTPPPPDDLPERPFEITVLLNNDAKDDEFLHLMCAAEYLSYLVATKSNLGFEAALEKISEGAMTWRHVKGGS